MSRFFANRQSVSNSVRRRKILRIEELEDRSLMSVYTPAQIMQAYGLSSALFGAANGAGQTIAIVDAYDAKNIRADLAKFDGTFLSDPQGSRTLLQATSFLNVVNQTGGTSLPLYNAGWSQEISLDVEWAHAIAPGANILLVEANSNSLADLFKAVDYAAHHATVVSMSWGANESIFLGETALDSHFNVPGVSFVASSGDTGAVPIYPAVSPYVLGVGGTSLNSIGTPPSESGWSGSGGGISSFESEPTYQSSVQSTGKRTSPDVAYVADPNTGVYVVWSGGTYAFGGTSAGAPQWAALVAIANQGRQIANAGIPNPLGATQLMNAIYNLPATDFNDITSGSTSVTVGRGKHGTTTTYATVGYDLVTGRGSPIADSLVHDLAAVTANGALPAGTPAAPTGGGTGQSAVPHFFVVEVPGGTITIVDPNDAAFVASVFAAKLLPGGSQFAPFVLTQTPFVFNPFDSRPDVARPADTQRTQPFSIGFMGVGENALPMQGDAESDVYFDGTFIHNIQLASTPHGSLCDTIEQTAAADAAPKPTLLGDDDRQPLPNLAPALTRVESAQPDERRTMSNVLTQTIVNVIGLAGAVAFFAHGALLGRSERAKAQRDLDQRESA